MIEILAWEREAWSHYLYWQEQDRKTLRSINALIEGIRRQPFSGIGKPKPLKKKTREAWARQIDKFNRLVYTVDDTYLTIVSCRFHYGK